MYKVSPNKPIAIMYRKGKMATAGTLCYRKKLDCNAVLYMKKEFL